MFGYLFPLISVAGVIFFFFFNDTATTEIYTLSLHDALPISTVVAVPPRQDSYGNQYVFAMLGRRAPGDRKSTRLNSSHGYISYAVFCLKKKKINNNRPPPRRTL